MISNIQKLVRGPSQIDLFRLLSYQVGPVYHVGAGHFEESEEYFANLFEPIVWFDPLSKHLPSKLPKNQIFYNVAISDQEIKYLDFYIYEHSNLSSQYELVEDNPVLKDIPKVMQKIKVPNFRLDKYQYIHDIDKEGMTTLVVDVQGGELSVLKSANLNEIDQIVVETSKLNMYDSDDDSYLGVKTYLESYGFKMNLDYSLRRNGHGDQYFSRHSHKNHQLLREILIVLEFLRYESFIVRSRYTRRLKSLQRRFAT